MGTIPIPIPIPINFTEVTNWKDAVALQGPFDIGNMSGDDNIKGMIPCVYVRYLELIDTPDNMNIVISSKSMDSSDYIYNDDTIDSAVRDAYNCLPEYTFNFKTDMHTALSFNMAGNLIAANTRRATGRTVFGGVLVYCGDIASDDVADAGLIVSQIIVGGKNMYALVKHPNFESYGFKLTA